MLQRLILEEQRVYRRVAFPVSAFDVLQDLKRAWRLETNGEVLTRLLLGSGRDMMKNADDADATIPKPGN